MRQAILGIELEGYYNRQFQNEMDGKGMEQKESKEEKKKKTKKKRKKENGTKCLKFLYLMDQA